MKIKAHEEDKKQRTLTGSALRKSLKKNFEKKGDKEPETGDEKS